MTFQVTSLSRRVGVFCGSRVILRRGLIRTLLSFPVHRMSKSVSASIVSKPCLAVEMDQ